MGDIDIALRHVTTSHPEDLARTFIPAGTAIREIRWLDTQLASRERRLDRCLVARVDAARRAIHHEWFLGVDAEMPWRMYSYGHDVLAALHDEDEAAHREACDRARAAGDPLPAPPEPAWLESCAVIIDGPAAPWPASGERRVSPPEVPDGEASTFRFRIVAVYQLDTDALLAMPGVFWLVFAPVARDASRDNLRRAVQAAAQRAHSRGEREAVASAMHVVATIRPRADIQPQEILDMLNDEGLIERTWLFQQGLSKGVEKGIEKGIEAGLERGLRDAVYEVLAQRGLRVSAAQRKRIEATHDADLLHAWIRRALAVKTVGALFEDGPAKARRRS